MMDYESVADSDVPGDGGGVCGTGEGACCSGSNDGCPPEAPVCSEYGYCQCPEYMKGGSECGPGFDGGAAPDPWPMDDSMNAAEPNANGQNNFPSSG